MIISLADGSYVYPLHNYICASEVANMGPIYPHNNLQLNQNRRMLGRKAVPVWLDHCQALVHLG